MIRAMVSAKTLQQMLPARHDLDRIIAHEHYLIPQWSASTHRMVYDAWRLAVPRWCRRTRRARCGSSIPGGLKP